VETLTGEGAGKYAVAGTVKDSYTGDALVGVQVSVSVGTKVLTASTNSAGQYTLSGLPSSAWVDANADNAIQSGELSPFTVSLALSPGTDYNRNATGVQSYPGNAYGQATVGFRTRVATATTTSEDTGLYDQANCPGQDDAGGASNCIIGAHDGVLTQVDFNSDGDFNDPGETEDANGNGLLDGQRLLLFDPVNDGSVTTLNFELGQARTNVIATVKSITTEQPIEGAWATIMDCNSNTAVDNSDVGPTLDPGDESQIRISLPVERAATNSSGIVTIANVPENAEYQLVVQKQGYQYFTSSCFIIPGGVVDYYAMSDDLGTNDMHNSHDIKLMPIYAQNDVFPPVVTVSSPVDGSNITTASSDIVITFNEPMDTALNGVEQSNVLSAVGFAGGQDTAAFANVPISARLTWSESTAGGGYDILTIDPVEDLYEGYRYQVDLEGAAFNVQDISGNDYLGWWDVDGDGVWDSDNFSLAGLPNNTLFTEQVDALKYNVVPPATGNAGILDFTLLGAAPTCSAPTIVAKDIQDGDGGTITLDWSDVTDARAYNVYGSWSSSPYVILNEGQMSYNPPSDYSTVTFWDNVAAAFSDPNLPTDWITYNATNDFTGNNTADPNNSVWDVHSINVKTAAVDNNGNECVTSAALSVSDDTAPQVTRFYDDNDADDDHIELAAATPAAAAPAQTDAVVNADALSDYVKYYRYLVIDGDNIEKCSECPGTTTFSIGLRFDEAIAKASVNVNTTAASGDYDNIKFTKGYLPCEDPTVGANQNSGTEPNLTEAYGWAENLDWPEYVDEDTRAEGDYRNIVLQLDDVFAVENGDYFDFTGLTDIAGNAIAAGDPGERIYLIDNIGPIVKSISLNSANDTIAITFTEAMNPDTYGDITITGAATVTGRSISTDNKTVTLTVDNLSLVAPGDRINTTATLLDVASTAPLLGETGSNPAPGSLDETGAAVGGENGVILPWFAIYGNDGDGTAEPGIIDTIAPRIANNIALNGDPGVPVAADPGVITGTTNFSVDIPFTEGMNVEADEDSPLWATSVLNPSNYTVAIAGHTGEGLSVVAMPAIVAANTVRITVYADPSDPTAVFAGPLAAGDTITVSSVTDDAVDADGVLASNTIDSSGGATGESMYADDVNGNAVLLTTVTGVRSQLKYKAAVAATATTYAVTAGWHRVD